MIYNKICWYTLKILIHIKIYCYTLDVLIHIINLLKKPAPSLYLTLEVVLPLFRWVLGWPCRGSSVWLSNQGRTRHVCWHLACLRVRSRRPRRPDQPIQTFHWCSCTPGVRQSRPIIERVMFGQGNIAIGLKCYWRNLLSEVRNFAVCDDVMVSEKFNHYGTWWCKLCLWKFAILMSMAVWSVNLLQKKSNLFYLIWEYIIHKKRYTKIIVYWTIHFIAPVTLKTYKTWLLFFLPGRHPCLHWPDPQHRYSGHRNCSQNRLYGRHHWSRSQRSRNAGCRQKCHLVESAHTTLAIANGEHT